MVEVNSDGNGDRGGTYSDKLVWGRFSVQEPRGMRRHAQEVSGPEGCTLGMGRYVAKFPRPKTGRWCNGMWE